MYRVLATTLPDDLPVYGIQSSGLSNPYDCMYSFEGMAMGDNI